MMEEILYLLAENTNESVNWLLKTYTFKIFPMINVDGVIYGNFRCDLGGFDLNRNWKNPDRYLHPQIFAIKEELEKIHN
jgi:murein tripeptide amidase MpaA